MPIHPFPSADVNNFWPLIQSEMTDEINQDVNDTSVVRTDNPAIVTAISSMSDLSAASLSSLKTTMGAEGDGDLSDIEEFNGGEPSSERPKVGVVELPRQSGTTEQNKALTAAPESDIDILINQSSQVGGKETEIKKLSSWFSLFFLDLYMANEPVKNNRPF